MRRLWMFLALLMIVLVAACDYEPYKVGDEYVAHIVKSITYVQDARTDICFAIIARAVTDPAGVTMVPCENVKHLLVKLNFTNK